MRVADDELLVRRGNDLTHEQNNKSKEPRSGPDLEYERSDLVILSDLLMETAGTMCWLAPQTAGAYGLKNGSRRTNASSIVRDIMEFTLSLWMIGANLFSLELAMKCRKSSSWR